MSGLALTEGVCPDPQGENQECCECQQELDFTCDTCTNYSKDGKMCLGNVCLSCGTCYGGICESSVKEDPS